jgi:hypothetical protein
MRTEAFQRFRAIQTNNESLPFVLATMNLTLSAAIIPTVAMQFTRSTNGTSRAASSGHLNNGSTD